MQNFDKFPAEVVKDPKKMTVLTMHPTWVQHSMTKILAEILEHQKRHILSEIEKCSLNPEYHNLTFRILGVRLREVNNTLRMIYDVNTCIEKYSLCN